MKLSRHLWASALAASALLATCGSAQAQTWTHLVRNPPSGVSLIILLSDGTVMAAANNGSTIGRAWYKLTPDATGSYINGTWTTLASMIDTRLYYSTQVLRDGRVWVAGGEYGTGGGRSEVYDPVANTWTALPVPAAILDPTQPSPVVSINQLFYDSNSEILPNGNVIVTPVGPKYAGQTIVYNPTTNAWSNGPNLFRGVYQDEASWVKLADSTILTIDPFGSNTERYNPVTNTWINDSVVPASLYDPFGFELGGALLLPNGKAFFLGSTGHTAIYTPTGTTAPGAWVAGPDIPGSHGTPDAPSAMLVTGKILCAVSPIPTTGNHFPSPTTFYEYDWQTNSFALVPAPVGASESQPTYRETMLDLPDGKVLYSRQGVDLYVYTPAGTPLASGKPAIVGITQNGDGSFHLTGTLLNGISEGATYGDDAQMNTNYPVIRINHSNGNVYYARTYNWSNTGVMTGALVTSTEYKLPVGMPAGAYTLRVTANGIASDPAEAPSVGVQPDPQTVCADGAASFSVTASGTGPFTYQWRRGVAVLTNGGNIGGATSTTLVISPVAQSDVASDYNCVITSALGSVTSSNAQLSFCYANCDCTSTPPLLNANDFQCFLNAFASGSSYANCDASTTSPVLSANDFQCFLNSFAAGCP